MPRALAPRARDLDWRSSTESPVTGGSASHSLAKPGTPPRAVKPHPWIRQFLFFAFDTRTRSVVVGPEQPCEARPRIEPRKAEPVERAVRRAATGALSLLTVDPPVVIEVEYALGLHADYAALVPGSTRVGDRGVRLVFDDPVSTYRAFLAANRLAGTAD